MIQHSHLGKYRRLIPVEVLVGDFAVLKLNDGGYHKLGLSTGRSHTWK